MDEALENEHTELLQFLYGCPVGLIKVDMLGAIQLINPLAMNILLTLSHKPFIENLFDILERYAPELRNLVDAYPSTQGSVCEAHRIFVKPARTDRSAIAIVLACTLVKLSGNTFIATLTDISNQVEQERRLKQAEMWFASLIDGVNDFAILSLDASGKIDSINSSLLRQTGFNEQDLLGRSLAYLASPDNDASIAEMAGHVEMAKRDGWHLSEGWQGREGGDRYWCQRLIAVRSEREADGNREIVGYTVVVRDVTRQDADTTKLLRLLRADHLTGICNRTHFFEIAERECLHAVRDNKPLSLISVDIDHFKTVNDTFGHAVGDEVLKAFAATCSSVIRSSDTFARIGGEEFAVLLPNTNLSSAAELAQRLLRGIAATTVAIPGRQVRITASLGCAESNALAPTLTELMSSADEALYAAKRAGRNQVALATTRQPKEAE